MEVFSKTTFEEALIEPIDTPSSCPFCRDVLYEFYAELPTEYDLAYVRVNYCLNCKMAIVHRSRYVKLHFRRHGIIPVPKNQTNLNIFLIEGDETHAAERP